MLNQTLSQFPLNFFAHFPVVCEKVCMNKNRICLRKRQNRSRQSTFQIFHHTRQHNARNYQFHETKTFVAHQNRNKSQKATSNLISILRSMPKDPKHIVESQKIRKKIKEKSSKYVPGRVTLQVLGTGAEGAPRSLYVFSDQSRYLFNCGEGTQRLAHEHKMKLAKLEHIFITQPVWQNIGGLPGTALTIQDVGVPEITLHGPEGLDELFVATKRFVIIKDLKIKMEECNENTTFEDNVMTVQYVPLERKVLKSLRDVDKNSSMHESVDTSFESSSISDNNSSLDSSNLDKDMQAGSSMDTNEASTSTRSERKRNRSRRNSQSVGRYVSEDVVDDDIDYYAHERKKKHKRKRRARSQSVSGNRSAPERISESSKLRLSETKAKGVSMSYICRLQPRPGALSLDKCVKYGVPAGPLLGKLKSGEEVTLESGVVVRSVDVCEPDDPGPVFIVIDCPTDEYLHSLAVNETLKKHQQQASRDEDFAYLVVHFTPKHVMENPRYKHWMNEFSPSTQHLVLNDSNTCMGSLSVHRIQHKLNILSPDIFPLLGDSGTEIVESDDSREPSPKKLKGSVSSLSVNEDGEGREPPNMEGLSVTSKHHLDACIHPNTFFNFHLRPRKGIDRSDELKISPLKYVEETMAVEGFCQAVNELKLKMFDKRKGMTVRSYPKTLFLGTGSCIPNKTRNTSGILFEASDSIKMIIDCGEGTYGQLVRFFGPDRVDEVLLNIQAVYISHLHADHHIGLIGLLQGRRRALDRLNVKKGPLLLLAPKQILNWLTFYDTCFENILGEFELVSNADLLLNEEKIDEGLKRRLLDTLNMTDVNTVLVRHCPNAFGVAFTHVDGYKITYSGDTMPCPNLVKLGMNSDLLIHEATMEDELAAEAVIKMHSTTTQAINVGKSMNAKHILLTHFSQRYAKLPRFNDNFSDNIGIAFDNMQIKLDELPLVPLLYPSLMLMFAEHYEELEHKAVKRQLRIERQRDVSKERQTPKQPQKV